MAMLNNQMVTVSLWWNTTKIAIFEVTLPQKINQAFAKKKKVCKLHQITTVLDISTIIMIGSCHHWHDLLRTFNWCSDVVFHLVLRTSSIPEAWGMPKKILSYIIMFPNPIKKYITHWKNQWKSYHVVSLYHYHVSKSYYDPMEKQWKPRISLYLFHFPKPTSRSQLTPAAAPALPAHASAGKLPTRCWRLSKWREVKLVKPTWL